MIKKFKPAFVGLVVGLYDSSIRIQWILGIVCVIVCSFLKLNYIEWSTIFICIGLVITTEYLNTAIERLADYIQSEQDEKIKYIKDISAAAVLFQSIIALIVFMIVLHHLWKG